VVFDLLDFVVISMVILVIIIGHSFVHLSGIIHSHLGLNVALIRGNPCAKSICDMQLSVIDLMVFIVISLGINIIHSESVWSISLNQFWYHLPIQ